MILTNWLKKLSLPPVENADCTLAASALVKLMLRHDPDSQQTASKLNSLRQEWDIHYLAGFFDKCSKPDAIKVIRALNPFVQNPRIAALLKDLSAHKNHWKDDWIERCLDCGKIQFHLGEYERKRAAVLTAGFTHYVSLAEARCGGCGSKALFPYIVYQCKKCHNLQTVGDFFDHERKKAKESGHDSYSVRNKYEDCLLCGEML